MVHWFPASREAGFKSPARSPCQVTTRLEREPVVAAGYSIPDRPARQQRAQCNRVARTIDGGFQYPGARMRSRVPMRKVESRPIAFQRSN